MKTIAIIGAMPSELADIRAYFSDKDTEVISECGFDFNINMMGDKRIVNVFCGVSKVNAAVCTQILIDKFNADAVINTGIAGGMHNDVKICDIVISNETSPHDVDLNFLEKYLPHCSSFKADEKLVEYAVKSCTDMNYNYHIGRIVSGEAFISDNAVKNDIKARLNPYAVDMESSAIGHCAYINKVPYISVRCISDNADDEGVMSFEEFEKIAAKRVADIVLSMVRMAE
ncbi:MAG: 5'-methylthioadenosine/adenosylhomocysteine nucleosidase [Oscillospiraceae bacterium]